MTTAIRPLFCKASGPVSHEGQPHWWLRCRSCEHLVLVNRRQVVGLDPISCRCGQQGTVAVLSATEADCQAAHLGWDGRHARMKGGRTP